MNLAFSTKINGKPTYFIDKIWDGLYQKSCIFGEGFTDYHEAHKIMLGYYWDEVNFHPDINTPDPKIHTIREDKSDRWKVGNKIHFLINNRTKNRFQFAPVIYVRSVQRVDIVHWGHVNQGPVVFIDGKGFDSNDEDGYKIIETLAKNDGFDSVEDFFDYFNKDFKGKIIGWTDFKY